MTKEILRLPQVKALTKLSRSSIYQMVADGIFPKPVKLIANGRAIGWVADDVHDYLTKITEKRTAA